MTRFYAEDMLTAATEQAKAANLAREIDEAAAETARLQATHAKREESDAHAKATHFTELANEAKARLKSANAASVAAQSEAMAATKQLENAISAEANAKVEAANALAVRDQRFAEITDAANAQKLIDEARSRDLEAISKSNASVRQLITLEQGGLKMGGLTCNQGNRPPARQMAGFLHLRVR